MFRSCKYGSILRVDCGQTFVALAAMLLFGGVVAAQDVPPAASRPDLSLLAPFTPPEQSSYVLATNDVSTTARPAAADPAAIGSPQVGLPPEDNGWHFA